MNGKIKKELLIIKGNLFKLRSEKGYDGNMEKEINKMVESE